MCYENDFAEWESENAIKAAKDGMNLPEGCVFITAPAPHCAITHNRENITAKVHISYINKVSNVISEKKIELKFHENNGRSFWSYSSSTPIYPEEPSH